MRAAVRSRGGETPGGDGGKKKTRECALRVSVCDSRDDCGALKARELRGGGSLLAITDTLARRRTSDDECSVASCSVASLVRLPLPLPLLLPLLSSLSFGVARLFAPSPSRLFDTGFRNDRPTAFLFSSRAATASGVCSYSSSLLRRNGIAHGLGSKYADRTSSDNASRKTSSVDAFGGRFGGRFGRRFGRRGSRRGSRRLGREPSYAAVRLALERVVYSVRSQVLAERETRGGERRVSLFLQGEPPPVPQLEKFQKQIGDGSRRAPFLAATEGVRDGFLVPVHSVRVREGVHHRPREPSAHPDHGPERLAHVPVVVDAPLTAGHPTPLSATDYQPCVSSRRGPRARRRARYRPRRRR